MADTPVKEGDTVNISLRVRDADALTVRVEDVHGNVGSISRWLLDRAAECDIHRAYPKLHPGDRITVDDQFHGDGDIRIVVSDNGEVVEYVNLNAAQPGRHGRRGKSGTNGPDYTVIFKATRRVVSPEGGK